MAYRPRLRSRLALTFLCLFLDYQAGGRSAAAEANQADIEALFFQVDELKPEAKIEKVKEILRLRSPYAVPFLIKLLADAEDFGLIRNDILAGIELTVDEKFLGELDGLVSAEQAVVVNAHAIRAAGFIPGPAASEKLFRLVDSEDGAVRTCALAALGECARPEAVPFLRNFLGNPPRLASELAAARSSLARQEKGQRVIPQFQAATVYERARVAVACEKGIPGWAKPSEWHLVGLGFGGSVGGAEWQLDPVAITPQSSQEGLGKALEGCSFLGVLPLSDAFAAALFATGRNSKALEAFLARGGWIFFEHGSLNPAVREWLKSVDVPVPPEAADKPGPHIQPAADDFHPILEFPFRLDRTPVENSFGQVWEGWDRARLVAPWRNSAQPDHAAMLVQPSVLGRGTVILSGIPGYLGMAEARHNVYAHVFDPQKIWAERGHFEISNEIVTPHRAWAKPLAGGPLRALFVLSRHAQREMIELAQRIELEADAVPLIDAINGSHQERWGPWAFTKSPRDRHTASAPTHLILEHYWNKPYDVLVVGNYSGYVPANLPRRSDWDLFPEWMKARILRRVAEGAGLVLIGLPGQVDRFTVAEGLEWGPGPASVDLAWPGERPQELSQKISCATFGKGRIALFLPGNHYVRGSRASLGEAFQVPGPLGPWIRFNEKDYVYSSLAKLLLWAGGRIDAPAACFEEIQASPEAIRLRLAKAGESAAALKILLSIQNRFGERVHEAHQAVEGLNMAMPLPALPAGTFVADLQLFSDQGQVLDWAAVRLASASLPRLGSCETDRESYRPGERVALKLRMTAGAIPGERVRLQVTDTFGRRVVEREQEVEAGAPGASLQFAVEAPLASLWHLRFSLWQGERVVDEGYLPLPIVRPEDRRSFSYCLVPAESYEPLAQLGVDTVDFPVSPGATSRAIESGLQFHVGWSYLNCLIGTPSSFPTDGVRNPCLSSPTFERGIRGNLQKVIPPLRRLGIRSFELQDETQFGGPYCFSPHCLARFRRWLREHYGSLERLNQAWGSQFKEWPQVRPLLLDAAIQSGHIGSWVDHREFMESVVAGWVELAQNCIREEIPDARVGLSGTYGVSPGSFDWWKLSRVCSVIIKYGEARGNEFHRSFDRGDLSLGNWGRYAYDMTDYQETYSRYGPWLALLQGENAFWFWGGYTSTRSDLRPYNAVAWSAEEIREIKAGLDTFCLGHLDTSGIGVHYSQRSMQVLQALNAKYQKPNVAHNWGVFTGILRELGLNFDFLSYEQVERGELGARPIRLLYLPCSISLSAAEIRGLVDYVESGGILVADFPPGIYDEHGNPRAHNPMEDLFGARFGHISALSGDARELRLELPLDRLQSLTQHFDKDAKLAGGGQSLGQIGDAPAFVVCVRGKGKAVFLNFNLALVSIAGPPAAPSALQRYRRSLMQHLVQMAGIVPVVKILCAADTPFDGDHALFRRGENLLLGFGKEGGYGRVTDQKPFEVTVTLDKPRYVYDVRRKKPLDQVAEFRISATPSLAEMYGLLPYKVTALAIRGLGECRPGGRPRFQFDLAAPAPLGEHVIHVRVTDGTGRERREYGCDLIAPQGRTEYELPLALDDPCGEWRMAAQDVASGVCQELPFAVKP